MSDVIELRRKSDAPTTGPERLSVAVAGMTCASCVGHVEKAIGKLPGVTGVAVNLATNRADVTFAGVSDHGAVVPAVESAGYEVTETEAEIGAGQNGVEG